MNSGRSHGAGQTLIPSVFFMPGPKQSHCRPERVCCRSPVSMTRPSATSSLRRVRTPDTDTGLRSAAMRWHSCSSVSGPCVWSVSRMRCCFRVGDGAEGDGGGGLVRRHRVGVACPRCRVLVNHFGPVLVDTSGYGGFRRRSVWQIMIRSCQAFLTFPQKSCTSRSRRYFESALRSKGGCRRRCERRNASASRSLRLSCVRRRAASSRDVHSRRRPAPL